MVRKQVYIEPGQEARLKAASRRLGLTEAALIRSGIDAALRARPSGADPGAWAAIVAWIRAHRRPAAGCGRRRTWTRDDLYDR